MLSEEEIEWIIKAGKITREIREKIRYFVKEKMKVIEICEKIEEEIRRLGGEPAFPCNIGIDYIGAHYTSPPNDETIINYGNLVKVDFGVHINGFIADTALTISIESEYEELIEVAEEALQKALEIINIGIKVSNIGEIIEKVIKSYGYKPISNLTGHSISKYMIHSGISIPNISGNYYGKIEPWSIYAIEPFVTLSEAKGEVINGPPGNILQIIKLKGPKNQEIKKFFEEILRKYRTLPFTKRWINIPDEILRKLLENNILYEYPTLIEATKKPIA
ncbi:MAG: type II methionyl aminopeptidase, partial [Candidatus Methanomethylicaceae archaeon]